MYKEYLFGIDLHLNNEWVRSCDVQEEDNHDESMDHI